MSAYEPRGRGFESCQPGHKSRTWIARSKSFVLLRDRCGSRYPQALSRRPYGPAVGQPQHGARLVPVQHEIRQGHEPPDVGARVVPGHRVLGVPKQCRTALCRTPAARNRQAWVCLMSCTRIRSNPTARRAFCQPVLFIESMRWPRNGNTQMGCKPRCACTIDHAASLRMTTWSRLLLKDSAGTTKTL